MPDARDGHAGPLVLAVASFGLATVLAQGPAIALVLGGAVGLAVAIFRQSFLCRSESVDRLILGVILLFSILAFAGSTREVIGSPPNWTFIAAGITWLGLGLGWRLGGSNTMARRAIFSVALATSALFGVVHIVSAEDVGFDVLFLHAGAAEAIADGVSPYSDAVTVPNGAPVGEEFIEGYPYPPLTAFAFAAGDWAAGDPRWTSLVSWLVVLAVIGSGSLSDKSGNLALGAMLMAAAIPSWPLVLTSGWTEPFSLGLLALTVAAWHRSTVSGVLGGLFVGSKQYLLAAAPVYAINRVSQRWSRFYWAAIALLVTALPILLWGVRDFVDAAVRFHLEAPARTDGTSIVGLLDLLGVARNPPLWLMISIVAISIVGVARRITDLTSWLAAVGLVLTIALFLSSQAFTNYWYLMTGVAALAISSSVTVNGSSAAAASRPGS